MSEEHGSVKVRNSIAIVLIVLSVICLIPGLYQPLLTLSASFEILGNKIEMPGQTRSILQTIETLHDSGNTFVAALILIYSVIVPFLKVALLAGALALARGGTRSGLVRFVSAISKWSMADVFIVAVYTGFLAANATNGLKAAIEPGFYWFAAYCLISLAGVQFLKIPDAPAR